MKQAVILQALGASMTVYNTKDLAKILFEAGEFQELDCGCTLSAEGAAVLAEIVFDQVAKHDAPFAIPVGGLISRTKDTRLRMLVEAGVRGAFAEHIRESSGGLPAFLADLVMDDGVINKKVDEMMQNPETHVRLVKDGRGETRIYERFGAKHVICTKFFAGETVERLIESYAKTVGAAQ